MVVFDRDTMVAAENAAIESGISQENLMENAGTAAAFFICENENLKNIKVTVVCGKGNNGGDGFVIARRLAKAGARVSVVLAVSPTRLSGESLKMYERLPRKVKLIEAEKDPSLADITIKEGDIIVDAIFGFGFKGEAKGLDKRLIEEINGSCGYTYSVDLPSGLICDSGSVSGEAIKADCTLTFETLKPCHILPPSNAFCGKLEVLKIGISEEIMAGQKPFCRVIEKPKFPLRDKNSHKGSFGSLLSVCGSYGMPGAAILAAKSALRSGVGKLYAVCPPENYTAMAVSVPEAVFVLADIEKNTKPIFENLKNVSSVLVGCGLSRSDKKAEFIKELILSAEKPIIVDADGINCTAQVIEFIKKVKADVVLTPHVGEMARLTGLGVQEIEKNRTETARKFATGYGIFLVLKGANTIVATPDGELFVNLTGTPALATSGSGDVLSGIIGSLLAQGFDTLCAVTSAVYIHGLAGERAAEKFGENGLLASDIIDNLPCLL